MQNEIIPASKIRKVIAKRLSESWNIAPHVCYTKILDCEELIKYRNQVNVDRQKEGKGKVSYNSIILKACAEALVKYPEVNGRYDGENVILNNGVNIGIAINTDNGLLVPNLKDVQSKMLYDISDEVDKLIELARNRKLKFADMEEGTFTISSLGSNGVDHATPIINQPETAILGTYTMKKMPVVVNDEVVVRTQQNFVLVADHRLVDGVQAADFINDIISNLENVEWLNSII